jgi:hypothetical protein
MWGCGGLRKYRDPFFVLSIGFLYFHMIEGVVSFKVALPTGSAAPPCSLIYKYNTKYTTECTHLPAETINGKTQTQSLLLWSTRQADLSQ